MVIIPFATFVACMCVLGFFALRDADELIEMVKKDYGITCL